MRTYTVYYPANIVIRNRKHSFALRPELVQEGKSMYGLIESTGQSPQKDHLVLLNNLFIRPRIVPRV
jgi:hypothetical protein